jgi:hypothetical protein
LYRNTFWVLHSEIAFKHARGRIDPILASDEAPLRIFMAAIAVPAVNPAPPLPRGAALRSPLARIQGGARRLVIERPEQVAVGVVRRRHEVLRRSDEVRRDWFFEVIVDEISKGSPERAQACMERLARVNREWGMTAVVAE